MRNRSCLFCKTKIPRGKYCSNSCSVKHQRAKTILKIKNGNYHSTDLRTIKRYLFETRGMKCELCGLSKWMGKTIPLVCDHGDSSNHKLNNLRLICNNCDVIMPTFKGRNRGSGVLTEDCIERNTKRHMDFIIEAGVAEWLGAPSVREITSVQVRSPAPLFLDNSLGFVIMPL